MAILKLIQAAIVPLAFIVASAGSINAATITITDGTFSNWSFGSAAQSGSSASVTVEGSGGNPGARLNITTVTGATAIGTAIDLNASTTTALTGNFTLMLDVLAGPGDSGQGQLIELLVQQGSNVYDEVLNITGVPNGWTTLTFTGTFTPSLFTRIIGSGPATPDFTGNLLTPTYFGFAGANSSSGTLTQYYDNFTLTYTGTASATPEPSTLSSIGSVSLLVGIRQFLRRKS